MIHELNQYYKQWNRGVDIQPLLVHDMPNEEYHGKHTHISTSWLKQAKVSMFEFLMYPMRPDKEGSSAQEIGSAVHSYLMERELFDKEYVVLRKQDLPFPDSTMSKKENAAYRDNLLTTGLTILTEDQFQLVVDMCRLPSENPLIQSVMKNGKVEASIFWQCEVTGLPLKTRPDIYAPLKDGTLIVIDPKTMDSAAEREANMAIAKWDYPMQAAMQCDGLLAATGKTVSKYFYLAIEKSYPYDYCLYQLSEEDIDYGRSKYLSLLNDIAISADTDIWSSHHDSVKRVQLPSWYYSSQ